MVACAEWSELAAGYGHTCGVVKADSSARCWGRNVEGQTTIPAVSGGWAHRTVGSLHTCGVVKADDSSRCWGRNGEGQSNVPKP